MKWNVINRILYSTKTNQTDQRIIIKAISASARNAPAAP